MSIVFNLFAFTIIFGVQIEVDVLERGKEKEAALIS
jgi:hypothetical protein